MANKRKDEMAEEMYEIYKSGKSLGEIADSYSISRQSVYKMFERRSLILRPQPTIKEFQEFNGNKYTKNSHGYYRKTNRERSFMHRDVWEFHNGPIPEGWDIHHKDENKGNNDISNFECLPKAEHTRKYSPHNNQFTKGRKRREAS